ISALGCSDRKASVGARGLTFMGSDTCSHFATTESEVPCINTDVTDTKNTILKIISAFSMPASNGYVAKTMGTAPRNPTQEIYNRLLAFILNGSKLRSTLKGLATTIKNKEISKPTPIMGTI